MKIKHGEGRKGRESLEYKTWKGMLNRCTNPNEPAYAHYGARGIVVCERWHDFRNFREDMGRRPSPDHSIDRIDNDGNYEPGNCRWVTRSEQNRNYSRNRPLTWNGRTMLLVDWAKEVGINATTIATRLDKAGWSIERALTTSVAEGYLSGSRAQAAKTHCPAGHEYTTANTYINGKGSRICRACNRDRHRKKTTL